MQTSGEISALFVFDYPPNRETFVIELNDQEKIAHARRIIRGDEKQKVHVSGIIVKSPAQYNGAWNFHLSPESITFFEFALEVCDASISYVAEHLDEVGAAFLPASRWCPWRSRLLRELTCVRQPER
jgi:hypothetical protein